MADMVLDKMFEDGKETVMTKKAIICAIEVDKIMGTSWSDIFKPNPVVRRMLLVVIGVAVAQQLCGIEAIIYYFPIILDNAGVEVRTEELGILAALGIFKTLVLGVSAWLLDRPGYTGRKTLLLVSLPGCGFSLALLAFGHTFDDPLLSIFSIFMYAFFFSVGAGPVCWLYASEVFPLHIRARGMSLAISLNRLVAASISLSFLEMVDAIGYSETFSFYAILCLLSTL